MAETTLQVTIARASTAPRRLRLSAGATEPGQFSAKPSSGPGRTPEIVSNGPAIEGHDLRIVDPKTCLECPVGAVGEVWVAGPTVARGYWNRPALTSETFHARLAEGELYVLGRIKELVIIRGRKHYVQDLEATVATSHPALTLDNTIAFGIDHEGEEKLVIVHCLERKAARELDPSLLFPAIRRAIVEVHEADPHAIVLVRPASLPRTTSGKLQRLKTREMFLADALSVVASWTAKAVSSDADAEASRVADELMTVPSAQRQVKLRRHLGERVCSALGLSEAPAERTRFTELGLDSLKAVQLGNLLNTELRLNPPLPATALFEAPTLAELAEAIEERLMAGGVATADSGYAPLVASGSGQHDAFGLTDIQLAYYLGRQGGVLGDVSCFAFAALRFPKLDLARLERALAALVSEQPTLRAVFASDLTQRILAEVPVYCIPCLDLSASRSCRIGCCQPTAGRCSNYTRYTCRVANGALLRHRPADR